MGLFSRKKKDDIVVKSPPTNDKSLTLTVIGKEKAEAMQLKSPYFEILTNLLEAGGTANIAELSERIGWPATKIEGVSQSLIRSGYVKSVKV